MLREFDIGREHYFLCDDFTVRGDDAIERSLESAGRQPGRQWICSPSSCTDSQAKRFWDSRSDSR